MVGPATEVVDRYIQGAVTKDGSISVQPEVKQTAIAVPIEYESSNEDATLEANLKEHFGQIKINPLPPSIEAVDVVEGDTAVMQGTGEVVIECVQILDADAHPRRRFRSNEDLLVSVTFSTQVPLENPIFGVALFRSDDVYVHGPNSKFDNVFQGKYHGTYTFFIRWTKTASFVRSI